MMQCLIIEDEKAAQEVLTRYITDLPFLSCHGVYERGEDVDLDLLSRVDIVFVDIQLPGLNGLTFLKSLPLRPHVIITTAFPNYAVEAFDIDVVDYLVKPFSFERFTKAVYRITQRLNLTKQQVPDQFFLYANRGLYNVKTRDIYYLKAEVDYVLFVTSEMKLLVLDSLSNWQEKLKDSAFVRVHRSYIVNSEHIDSIKDHHINIGDVKIAIGKKYRDDLYASISRF